MPNKDPNLWAVIAAFYHQHSNAIHSFVMAFFVAFFRICYVGKERKCLRIFAESVLCGLLAIASESIFEWLNMPQKLAVALGAIIALFGIDKVRAMAIRYAIKKH